jgi:hypothetical protein
MHDRSNLHAGGASNGVLDFEQARSFALQPLQRILYGLALCFLAALLATEAKVAWAAQSGGSPNDITAIKLCPVAGKWIDRRVEATSSIPESRLAPPQLGAILQHTFVAKWGVSPAPRSPRPVSVAEHPYFSALLFLRPPPAL